MYTIQTLLTDLAALGIDPNGTLMAHLSYKAIGEVEGRGDAVLDALSEYMRGGLLVLPGHTWRNVNAQNPVMDVLYTPVCVGVLPELFRKRPGVRRSLHPTHSLAALGAGADDFAAGEALVNTPCGENGAYYKLWERDAQILLIGVNYTRNTFIHGIEEWEHAKDSIAPEEIDMYVIDYEGRRLYTPQRRHCAPLGSDTFGKLEAPAMQAGILTIGKFGGADARLTRAQPLRALAAGILKDDPGYLLRF